MGTVRMCIAVVAGLLLFAAAASAAPARQGQQQERFHITYGLEGSMQGSPGGLRVSVYNTTGHPARDVVIWVAGPNHVTFDNHRITIGTLADGQHGSVLEPFRMPAEAIPTLSLDDRSGWVVEYTAPDGTRRQMPATGIRVR